MRAIGRAGVREKQPIFAGILFLLHFIKKKKKQYPSFLLENNKAKNNNLIVLFNLLFYRDEIKYKYIIYLIRKY